MWCFRPRMCTAKFALTKHQVIENLLFFFKKEKNRKILLIFFFFEKMINLPDEQNETAVISF